MSPPDAGGRHRGGSGPPLVLIHGFTATWRSWLPVLPALEAEHDVLAVGLAGHLGCPPLPPGTTPSVAALADGVERDLDAAGMERPHVVGNSLGGAVALELATRGRVASVVGLAPAGGWDDERVARALARRLGVASRVLAALAPRAGSLVARPRFRRLLLGQLVARPERLPPAEVAHSLEAAAACTIVRPMLTALAGGAGVAQGLGAISCPVLLAWGSEDRILPVASCTPRFVREIPGVRLVELTGVGHAPMSDDPELVAQMILGFTARQDAAATVS